MWQWSTMRQWKMENGKCFAEQHEPLLVIHTSMEEKTSIKLYSSIKLSEKFQSDRLYIGQAPLEEFCRSYRDTEIGNCHGSNHVMVRTKIYIKLTSRKKS